MDLACIGLLAAAASTSTMAGPYPNPYPDCFDDRPELRAAVAATGDPRAAGLLYSSAAFQHLQRPGAVAAARAVACLGEAQVRLPNSAVVARDLATAWVRLERWDDAAKALASARELGDDGPEIALLASVLAARQGDAQSALRAAAAERTWRSDLVATRLGSPSAKDRVLSLLPETSRRSTLGRLVLAMSESEAGDLPSARRLAADAEEQAAGLGLASWAASARALGDHLVEDTAGWQGRLRIRTALEYATNPEFAADAPSAVPFRVNLTAEGGLGRSFGRLVAFGAARVEQHFYLNERERLQSLDIFAWSIAAGLRYPLSADPKGVAVGLAVRFRDVFGARFGEHFGFEVEGGPELYVRVAGNLQARLAVYGVLSDFIDRSPPDGVISAVSRDRNGQRAILTFNYRNSGLVLVADAMFLRDQAEGAAFDAIGGGLAFKAAGQITEDLWLHASVSGTLREYGPVGDAAVIGLAATRQEFRTAVSVGARWAFTDLLSLVLEDVWVGTAARDLHQYANNVLTLGLEAQW